MTLFIIFYTYENNGITLYESEYIYIRAMKECEECYVHLKGDHYTLMYT